MITLDQLRKMVAEFPEVSEEPHFEKMSFRIRKRIFATYDEQLKQASIKLSAIDQSVFCAGGQTAIYPAANKWGAQGWTLIDLENVNIHLFKDALVTAYCEVAPKKLSGPLRPKY